MLTHTMGYCYHINSVPRTYDEAVKCERSVKWKVAIKEEIDISKEDETFELTQLPPNKTLIPAQWAYSIKTDQNQKEIYKASLATKGGVGWVLWHINLCRLFNAEIHFYANNQF